MFHISLKNSKTYQCSENETLIEGARKSGIILEHSCLSGRCSSCKVKVTSGISSATTLELGLSVDEVNAGDILSCVRKPMSDMKIEAEDLSEYGIVSSKIVAAKINSIDLLTDDVIKITLRFPPNQFLQFIAGQYVNLIKGNIKRSYSIASAPNSDSIVEFFIKKYDGGLFSNYLFNEAKVNDLLRVEGPKGTFFLRNIDCKNVILLATGTVIAPVKAILESINANPTKFEDKSVYVFWGGRYFKDLFWTPSFDNFNLSYTAVLSREKSIFAEFGYVQDVLLNKNIELSDSVVYACGSNSMIQTAKDKLVANGLMKDNFYSDSFVISN